MPETDPDKAENLRGVPAALARWMGRVETKIDNVIDNVNKWDLRWNILADWQRKIEFQLTTNTDEIRQVRGQSESNSQQITNLDTKIDCLSSDNRKDGDDDGDGKGPSEGKIGGTAITWKAAFFILLGVMSPVVVWFVTKVLPAIIMHIGTGL